MSRIFVTGSTLGLGLGLAAVRALIGDGHRVVLHARDERRARDIRRGDPQRRRRDANRSLSSRRRRHRP